LFYFNRDFRGGFMNHYIKSAAVAVAIALQAGAALAADADLPKSGMVTREGTVERVVDKDTFILRDKLTNKTVDVHTTGNNQVAVGDRVLVKGKAESEMLGMGHQIVSAAVSLQSSGAKPSAGGTGGPYSPIDNDTASGTNNNTTNSAPANTDTDNATAGSRTSTGNSTSHY
jgi:hypothetical protein